MRNQLQYMSTVYLHGNEEIKFESGDWEDGRVE